MDILQTEKISHSRFNGRLTIIGCGSIGQAVLPLLGNHLEDIYERTTVLAADEGGRGIAERCGAKFIHCNLTPSNYRTTLKKYIAAGDLLLNLSIEVSSIDLIRFCAERGALYVDTSVEPWAGVFDNPLLTLQQRTNYVIRTKILDLAKDLGPDAPTAVVDHGANPGMVSHFVKQALVELERTLNNGEPNPQTREEWALLAQKLNITTIQISERDTQASSLLKQQHEFVNTWSTGGFVDELMQPAELAYGTHEKHRLKGSREHRSGSGTLYLKRPGASTFARSWVPSIGSFQGMLVTHDEVFSLADYLSVYDNSGIVFRPSVMFVYHPCNDAMLSAMELEGSGWKRPQKERLLTTSITEGMDELGVLLAGHSKNAFWYGSQLDIDTARRHVPSANATIMQVVTGALAATVWAINNPRRGVVEPESLDYQACLGVASLYLGNLEAAFTEWTPLDGRGKFFPERLDVQNPWQMQNILSRQWYGD